MEGRWTRLCNSKIPYCCVFVIFLLMALFELCTFLMTASKITLGSVAQHKSEGNDSCPLYLTVSSSLTWRQFDVWEAYSLMSLWVGRGFCLPVKYPRDIQHGLSAQHLQRLKTCLS